jgi:two-component system response regulator HydG
LEELESQYIVFVLNSCDNNKSRAAEILGIDPSTLYRKLSRSESDRTDHADR